MIKINKLSKFYEKAKSVDMIKNRYEKCIPAIRLTLKRIVPSDEFQNLKQQLRLKGWKDWHILLAIYNLVLHYRTVKQKIKLEESEYYAKKILEEEKEEDIQVPISEFTEKKMTEALRMSMLSTLGLLGFSFPKRHINPEEVETFLRDKFNYFEDDVDHEPIFDIE